MTLEQRIDAPGPKKILALDGGGILGLMTVEVLAKIEAFLRQRLGRGEDFVLADYFDFVCGTSTGAVIATCIAMGMPTARIRSFYIDSGKEMFVPANLFRRLHAKFDDEPLAKKLRAELGADTTLGSDKLRTLLMMVMRNATTDSPWPVSNNPRAKYNRPQRRAAAHADCNLDLPLWKLVRASTAAPTFFPPEVAQVGNKTFIFVDGGVTTYNNPAFLAFAMATAEPYGVRWPVGEDKMLVVSIGTGTSPRENAELKASDMHLLYNATGVPSALMNAAQAGQDLMCRVFGKCVAGDPIDREVGDLIGAAGPVSPKLFTYMRYDPDVTRAGLDKLGLADVDPKKVQTLDSVDYIDDIQKVGRAFAEQRVDAKHFTGFM